MADLTLQDVRTKFPQYADMSDEQLVNGLHQKFYSDMPQEQFYAKVGYKAAPPAAPAEPSLLDKVNDLSTKYNPLDPRHLASGEASIPNPVQGALATGGEGVMNLLGKIVSGYHGLLTLGTGGSSDAAADTVNADRKAVADAAATGDTASKQQLAAVAAPVTKAVKTVAAPIDKAVENASPGVRTFVPAAEEATQDIASLLPIGQAGRAGKAAEAAVANSGKVTGGSAIENARGMGFKFAPSDVASRAPADAIEGSIPGMKREGLAGSPEVRKEATLHNTATATKEAGKFIGAGDDVRALTPQHFDTAQQPHYNVYRETGEAIGNGKRGSPEFQQALSDAVADQRPQAMLAPKVARVAQQNIARAQSGNLDGAQMVKDISFLRANGGTKLANAFEDEMERQLGGAETLTDQAQKFKDARRSIAQIRTIQDNTTGGQVNLQGVKKVHEDTNGKLLTGPLKVMAEAAAAAPGSMRLPLGGVGSTVKGKTIFEAGKNAAAKVAQKIVPGLNPLGNAVQNQFGRTAGEAGRSYLNTAGEKVKPTAAFELKNAPGKVGEITPDQGGMNLPQGPGPREPLDLTQPPGQPIEPLQRGFDLGGQGSGLPQRTRPEPRASHLLPAPGQTAPRGARTAPIAVTPEGKARLPDTVKDFEKDAASKENPASARRADIGSMISGGKRGEAQTAAQQLVNDLGSPEAVGDALAGLGVPRAGNINVQKAIRDYDRQQRTKKRGKD